jgi:hypothetical protein
MSWQPQEEKDAERRLIREFVDRRSNTRIVSLQDDDDDGGTDGVIEREGGGLFAVEARRKGFPNHSGKTCRFDRGWETGFLARDGGIFLNELTIRKHKDRGEGFVYLVEIKGCPPRAASVNLSRIDELLSQPHRTMRSTNSRNPQSVKSVPLEWFKVM